MPKSRSLPTLPQTMCLRRVRAWICAFSLLSCSLGAGAQSGTAYAIFPAAPSSADTILVKIPLSCTQSKFTGNPYSVQSANNRIRITLGPTEPVVCPSAAPPVPPLLAELGRLPAGEYLLDVYGTVVRSTGNETVALATGQHFSVTDDRADQRAPYVWRDVSGHWWNPDNNGEGFLVWHDRNTDQFMAAWFTYDTNGEPMWYTVQGGQWTTGAKYSGAIYRSTRNRNIGDPPPPRIIASQLAGSGTFEFGSLANPDEATFTFTLLKSNYDYPLMIRLKRFQP